MKQHHFTSLFKTTFFSGGILLMSLGVFTSCKKQADVTPAKAAPAAGNQQPEYVSTPFGQVPASKVHLVEQGTEITEIDGNVKKINSATGAILVDYGHASSTARSANNTTRGSSAQSFAASSSGGTLGNGYYVYSPLPEYKNIQSFSTSWVVPSAPAKNPSSLFIWNGADNIDSNCFMQPVLVWNNTHGKHWFVQNWGYANGNYFESDAIKVASGTIVTGVMTQISAKTGAYKYTISFTGYSSINYTQTFLSPANEVIECFENHGFSYTDFPADPLVAMQSMNLQYVGEGSINQPIRWKKSSDEAVVTPSGKNTVIKQNNTNNSVIDFYFQ